MKKFLILFAALMFLTSNLIAEAKKPTAEDIPEIGFNILESNKIQKRMIFKYTSNIKNPRARIDWKPENAGLVYTDRTIWVYGDALDLTDDENELAGLLSQTIALGENSYKGLFRGFFSNMAYSFNPRPKENKADLKAVDYMVKAGYNPVALITIYNKTLGQTRYEWCHYYPLATKRMANIYAYIKTNYPEYLVNNAYANNIYYKNFLHSATKEINKTEKKMSKKSRMI